MRIYTYTIRDREILQNSSSGGAFSAIALYVLKNQGVVYGSSINKTTGNVEHIRIDNQNDLEKLRGAKYVFSNLGNSFKTIRDDLRNNVLVLFSGTPCQVNTLYNFLDENERKNLILIDIICHGAPLPKYWSQYILEYNFKAPYNINFREKHLDWKNYFFHFNSLISPHSTNDYFYFFIKNYLFGENCYNCTAKSNNRKSDITLGDAWGIENITSNYNANGVSLVIQNTNRFDLIKILKKSGELNPVPQAILTYFNPSYYTSSQKPKDYTEVCKNIGKHGFRKTYKKYNVVSLPKKIRSKISFLIKQIFFNKILFKNKINKCTKIGIVSDYYYNNFGNKLQSFALQFLFKQNNIESQIIAWEDEKTDILIDYFKIRKNKNKKRRNAIFKCSIKYENNPYIYKNTPSAINDLNKLKVILFGSDQIWNYKYHNKLYLDLGLFNGHIIKPKRYSYAASIGTLSIDENLKSLYLYGLQNFETISVRENKSIETLNAIGLKNNIRFDLDPTLLMTKVQWEQYISKFAKTKLPKTKYILAYALSSKTLSDKANFISKKENLTLIDCMDPSNKYFCINQFDFINLIKNAEYIITDSYHALIFSIIFQKKVMLLNRESNPDMNMRIISLFEELNLNTEAFNNEFIDTKNITSSEIFKNLTNESKKYLNEIIAICNKADKGNIN